MSFIESNRRKPTLCKTETTGLQVLVRNRVTLCIVMSVVLVSLFFLLSFGLSSGSDKLAAFPSDYAATEDVCYNTSDDSEELKEYFSGRIEYSDTSGSGTPTRVLLRTRSYISYSWDSVKTEGAEGDDEFVLELRDVDDRAVKSINFVADPVIAHVEPTPEALKENPGIGTIFKYADFHIFLSNAPNFTSFAVLHEGKELEIEEHSANSPCLSVIWQIEGQVFDNFDSIPVSFEATDVGGDDLVYNIFYSKNGGNSYRSKLSGTVESEYSSVDIPVASLDGSARARLAVMVTDGTRTVFTESPIFTVVGPPVPATTIPVNQPPVAIDDFVEVEIWETLEIDVLANDIDPEGNFEDHSLVIDEFPVLGTADVRREYVPQQAGTGFSPGTDATWKPVIAYIPSSSGVDALVYSVCDAEGLCDSAQVTIESGIADCTIMGTENSETLTGTPGDDVICGLGGDDTIHAGGGDDVIKAGSGDDTVLAGAGDDTIFGEAGNDTIDSGAGDDIARGGNGRDYIKGGEGADRLYGESGRNILDGGLGDDSIYGGKGSDRIWGGYGDDLIYGGMGNDTIWAGAGDDTIRDSRGNDIIYPGQGEDTITGTNSEDTIIEASLSCLRLEKYSYQTAKTLLTLLFC